MIAITVTLIIVVGIIICLKILMDMKKQVPTHPLPTTTVTKEPPLKVSIPGKLTVQVQYNGNKGVSNREITINSVKQQENDYILYAYCHNSKGLRSFRLSRVMQMSDVETGEVYDDFVGKLASYM